MYQNYTFFCGTSLALEKNFRGDKFNGRQISKRRRDDRLNRRDEKSDFQRDDHNAGGDGYFYNYRERSDRFVFKYARRLAGHESGSVRFESVRLRPAREALIFQRVVNFSAVVNFAARPAETFVKSVGARVFGCA